MGMSIRRIIRAIVGSADYVLWFIDSMEKLLEILPPEAEPLTPEPEPGALPTGDPTDPIDLEDGTTEK